SQLAVAVTDVEDDGLRRVLLGVRNQEVQQKALGTSRRSKDESVADVLNVEVERVRRPVGSLESGERLPTQVGTNRVAVIQREQETQISDIGLEQREPAEVVS